MRKDSHLVEKPMKQVKLEVKEAELTSVELKELGRKLGKVIEEIWMKGEEEK